MELNWSDPFELYRFDPLDFPYRPRYTPLPETRDKIARLKAGNDPDRFERALRGDLSGMVGYDPEKDGNSVRPMKTFANRAPVREGEWPLFEGYDLSVEPNVRVQNEIERYGGFVTFRRIRRKPRFRANCYVSGRQYQSDLLFDTYREAVEAIGPTIKRAKRIHFSRVGGREGA